jgi:hypothetical protein
LVHLEVTVTNPLGARGVSAHWTLQVDFRDGTLPDDRDAGTDPAFAGLDFTPKEAWARQALTLEITSDVLLSAPPQLEVQGRTFTAEAAPGADGEVHWIVSIPEGLAPAVSGDVQADLAQRVLPAAVVVRLTGQVEGGASSAVLRVLRLNRGVEHALPSDLRLQTLDWDLGRVDARAPVPLAGGVLVMGAVTDAGEPSVVIVGRGSGASSPDGGVQESEVTPLPSGSRLLGFNDRGAALILDPALRGIGLQRELGSDAYLDLPAFPLPEPGLVSEPVRKGSFLCTEQLDAWLCTQRANLRLQCVGPDGIQREEQADVPAVNGAAPGTPALMAVDLPEGFVTFGYPGGALDDTGLSCGHPGNQLVSYLGGMGQAHGSLGLTDPDPLGGPVYHLALAAGPSSAVVGYDSSSAGLDLRLFDLATGQSGLPYFSDGTGNLPPEMPWAGQVLLAREDGLLLALSQGSLFGWRPGEVRPSVSRTLELDLGVPAPFPWPYRITGQPHVRHGANVVTLALADQTEGRVIVLELEADLSVRWAWRSEPALTFNSYCGLYGLPDGSVVDLVCWGSNGRDQLHRIAR